MSQINLSNIEQTVLELPVDEQLLLISRIAGKLRESVKTPSDFERELELMSQDADVQRELKDIEADFRQTEFDGVG